MAKISISIRDDLDDYVRRLAYERTKGKKGTLSAIIEECIQLHQQVEAVARR